MRRLKWLCALLISAMCMTAQSYELRVLTFEDEDVKEGFSAATYVNEEPENWSALIPAADDQGNPAELYADGMGADYSFYWWNDGGNTELFSELNEGYGSYCYWSGGHAISRYWSSDIKGNGDYTKQLTIYRSGNDGMNTSGGGHNGSNNFAVHFGYNDGSQWSTDGRVTLKFADGVARVIDHMWVCPTTYALNCYIDGNGLTSNLSEDDYVKLIAEGFVNDSKVSECDFVMAHGSEIVMDWTKWDLSSLGSVDKVLLNIVGTNDNGYGFSQPAYFAYDDIAVRFPKEGGNEDGNEDGEDEEGEITTDIPTVKIQKSARKVLINGHIFIIRDNEVYTIEGRKVK